MAKRHDNDADGKDDVTEMNECTLRRRGFLSLAGAAAFAAGATSATGTARAATVDLGSEGLSDGDEIDPYLDEHFTDGNEVHIPEGTYEWRGSLGDASADASLIGDGDVVFDTGDDFFLSTNIRASSGTVRIANITHRGAVDGDEYWSRIACRAESGARLVLENFNRPDGQNGNGDAGGFYVPRDHAGTVVFRNCHVEGFGNNGLYASSPGKSDGGGGRVIVEGGLFRNNNVASIRIGSNDSVVRGVTLIHDDTIPRMTDGSSNGRGIWVREYGDDITIEDCDITFTGDADGATGPIMVQPHDSGGSGSIRNTRVRNDRNSDAIMVESGDWSGENIHLTGSGNLSYPDEFSNVCVGDECDAPATDEGDAPQEEDETDSDSSNDEEDSLDGSRVEVVAADGGPLFAYSMVATGTISKVSDGTDMEAENNDSVSEDGDGTWTADGQVGNGYGDTYDIEGDLQSFETDTDPQNFTLRVDGDEVDPSTLGESDDSEDSDEPGGSDDADFERRIIFDATGGRKGSYSFEVSGDLEPDDEAGPLEGNDTISGSSAEGKLWGGYDAYRYSGNVVNLDVDGSVTVVFEELE